MAFELISFSSSLIKKQAVNDIIKSNNYTVNYGLVITEQQAINLVETSTSSLKANGRIEFGGGVIDKIIYEFCDSPYISMRNYEDTLHELIELFYYYKNETLDLVSDDDLIHFMGKAFNGECYGSLDLLYGRELTNMARNLRYGYAPDYTETEQDETDEDEEDEYGEH